MKSGVVRAMDDLGRIVVPKEIRRLLNVKEGDLFEIIIDEQHRIVLIPCKLQCVACGDTHEEELRQVNGVHLCPECIKKFGGART